MPVHNWKPVPVGLFHHFHQQWTGKLCDGLNDGVLPEGYFALIDQRAVSLVPDVLTLKRASTSRKPRKRDRGGYGVVMAPPKARVVTQESDAEVYAARANRLAIRNVDGDLIAIIEIVSPGNKHNKASLQKFVEKAVEFLQRGVHLLVVDLFPPTKRDPHGIHKAIWDSVTEEPFDLPADKPLTLAAYQAGPPATAYVDNIAAGDPLPPEPIFLSSRSYIMAPLEATYQATWKRCPVEFRATVEKRIASARDDD